MVHKISVPEAPPTFVPIRKWYTMLQRAHNIVPFLLVFLYLDTCTLKSNEVHTIEYLIGSDYEKWYKSCTTEAIEAIYQLLSSYI